jgi:hypothetical protein
MDLFMASAYAVVSAYVGFVVGLFVRDSKADRRPPGGGEPPAPPPPDAGPNDWTLWEHELDEAPVS